jgi:hypothetical protein
VCPPLPISDSKAYIHGITEDDLKDVKYTLRHAQAFLLSICCDRTILVGHGICHDLKTLRFAHR